MSKAAPASLTSSLLARKGEARPAALPEDNYSPFAKSTDNWRQADSAETTGRAEEAGRHGDAQPDAAAPSLFDGLRDASGPEGAAVTVQPASEAATEGEARPEAALSQIRVQRPDRVRLQPAVNDPADSGVDDTADMPEAQPLAESEAPGAPNQTDAAAEQERALVARFAKALADSAADERRRAEAERDEPVGEAAASEVADSDAAVTADHGGEAESVAHEEIQAEKDDVEAVGVGAEAASNVVELAADADTATETAVADARDLDGLPPTVDAADAALFHDAAAGQPAATAMATIAVPPEIAAAALHREPSAWRRHAMTFGLSFLVGGALAFAGWSIYNKGHFGANRAETPAVASTPSAAVPAPTVPRTAATRPASSADSASAVQSQAAAPAVAEITTAKPTPPAADKPQVLSVRFTDDGRATIVGSAAANSQVLLLDNGALLATLTADADGIWSYLGDAALADGSHTFAVAAVASRAAATLSTAPAAQPETEAASGAVAGSEPSSNAGAALRRPLPPPIEAGDANANTNTKADADAASTAAGADNAEPAAGPAGEAAEQRPDGENALDPAVVPLPAERRERSSELAPEFRYVVQLASVPSEADARRFWQDLSRREPDLTEKHHLLVHAGKLPQGRTVFRVRAGPFDSRQAAQQACRSFRPVIKDCLVVRRLQRQS